MDHAWLAAQRYLGRDRAARTAGRRVGRSVVFGGVVDDSADSFACSDDARVGDAGTGRTLGGARVESHLAVERISVATLGLEPVGTLHYAADRVVYWRVWYFFCINLF